MVASSVLATSSTRECDNMSRSRRRRSISVSELVSENTVTIATSREGCSGLASDAIQDVADVHIRIAHARKLFIARLITSEDLALVESRLNASLTKLEAGGSGALC